MCPGYKEPKRGFTELFKVDSSQILKKETRADQLKMIIASFKSCPYMSKGETINVASWGCNPYMYITDDNQVILCYVSCFHILPTNASGYKIFILLVLFSESIQ